MKSSISIIAVTICSLANAQIDLDSLKRELDQTFSQKRSSNNWNAYTIQYLNPDSLLAHEISFNNRGHIEEDIWGIALTSNKYDEKGRIVETRYIDIDGKLTFTDWPPIIRYGYNKSGLLKRKDYLNEDEKPVSAFARLEIDYDKDGDRVEDRMYDGDFNLSGENCITRYEYNEEKNKVTRSRYNEDNTIHDPLGWAYVVETYVTNKREVLIEKRYLNRDKELTSGSKQDFAIVKHIYGLRENWIKVEYYDESEAFLKSTWEYDSPSKN